MKLHTLKYQTHTIYYLFLLAFLLWQCNISPKTVTETSVTDGYYYDLDSVMKAGKLRVLMEYSTTGYFIYKGVPMGFEYDILNNYCRYLGVQMEVIPIESFETVFNRLDSGYADVIAANLTITKERTKKVAFTLPHLTTRQVLVQLKKEYADSLYVSTPLELGYKEVTTHKNTSFYERLVNLSDEIGAPIHIKNMPNTYSSEQLIDMVAEGKINYTVADENVAKVLQHFYPNIDVSVPLSLNQKIAFAMRKNSRKLLMNYNLWFKKFRQTRKYKFLKNKYFKNRSFYATMYESNYYYPKTGQISPYDDLIKQYAQKINWDWELLAAMIYQESHFNPRAKSWSGAFGIMQLMPNTAKRFGVDSTSSVAEQIAAGVRFLSYLDKQWQKTITDSVQRIKFVLASYNVGLGHIIDARNLAEKYGANPVMWDKNVENFIKLKSYPKYYKDPVVKHGYCRGIETYLYVRKIWERYIHYKNFTSVALKES